MVKRYDRTTSWSLLVGVGLALPLLFGSCRRPEGQASRAATRPEPGGTLVVAASTDIGGVNELLSATSSFTQSVLNLLFLKLFEEQPDFDRNPPSFAPQLVESYTWSDDHTQLTLALRRDVVWNTGESVTAADVVWTWRAQTDPQVAWALADAKENIASIEAIDAHTVRVVYHRPNAHQLADLNEGVILPSAAWSQLPFSAWHHDADWFFEHLVTNGPFRLQSWDRQQQVVLQRNPDYFVAERPHLDRVVFRIVPQKVNQVGHLLSGEVHFVDHLPAAEADRIAATVGFEVEQYWARQYDFICWNTARPLFADADVRRALTQAIDRQALIDALWFGHARISVSPIISSVWAHNRQIEPWPYDSRSATAILASHGWRDSDGDGTLDRLGSDFTFTLLTNTNSSVRVDAAVMIQEQLARVGIRMDIQRLEFNALIEKTLAHDFDAMLGGWTIDTSLDLDYAFHSDSIDGGYNFGAFVDPEVDRLLERIRLQTEPAAIATILGEVQYILHRQQPYTFLWEPQRLTGMVSVLKNAHPNALDPFYRLPEWWLEPPR